MVAVIGRSDASSFFFKSSLVQALVGPGGENVVDVTDALHVFLEERPDADRVLASFSPLHLVLQRVGRFQCHGGQNLSSVGGFFVERLVDFEGEGGGGDEGLLLEGHDVAVIFGDGHDGAGFVAQLPGGPTDTQSRHERLEVVALVQLELAQNHGIDASHLASTLMLSDN